MEKAERKREEKRRKEYVKMQGDIVKRNRERRKEGGNRKAKICKNKRKTNIRKGKSK
jgi:hypothetical protein